MSFKNKFDAGELDKWSLGAIDDPMYQRGVAWLENFNILRMGGINRRKGFKKITKILEGTEDKDVKFVPLSGTGRDSYLLYISKSKYGYLKFDNYDLVDSKEYSWPSPIIVPENRTVKYYKYDPNSYYQITSIKEIFSDAIFEIDDVLDIGGATQIEPGKARVSDIIFSDTGKLVSVAPFVITPECETLKCNLTQTPRTEPDASYFQEAGCGKGLMVSAELKRAPGSSTCTLVFTVLSGGQGFTPDEGQNTTQLELFVDTVGDIVVTATVSEAGSITSIRDYKLQGFPDTPGANKAVLRYNAPPIEPGEYTITTDCFGEIDRYGTPATVRVSVEPIEGGRYALAKNYYRISFERLATGSGFRSVVPAEGTQPTSNGTIGSIIFGGSSISLEPIGMSEDEKVLTIGHL